ncbi:nucleotidyltransferase domain-containing protein [Candidatus Woesearchaeota archaeon]|nr:nucleotidyltransferase domain-containing protein [Candidatus Woesearchaeota archaeon]
MYRNRNNELEVISLYRANYKESRFYLRQISKLAKIPLKTCQTALMNLEKEKVLKSKIEGKNKYFALNLDNIKAKSNLLQAEIYRTDIFLEAYPQIKTFLKSINTNIPIIVFGSFARLKADRNSDLDLLIVAGEKQKLPYHLLPYKVHQVNISENSFSKAIKEQETLVKEIGENHVILNNHSFYINVMWGYYGK